MARKKGKSEKAEQEPTPMDPAAENTSTPYAPMHKRNAFALDTLAREVEAIFPEVQWVAGEPDGRGVALAVEFGTEDLFGLDALLDLVQGDLRVLSVEQKPESVKVTFRSSARLQDRREPFDLARAWSVLCEDFQRDEEAPEDTVLTGQVPVEQGVPVEDEPEEQA